MESETPSRIALEPSVILFDGVCNLCAGVVRFVAKRDPRMRFRFASLQSPASKRLLLGANAPAPLPDSIALLEGGRVFVESDAALRIARGLRFPWPALGAFLIVPRPIRDTVYRFIARRRHRWFGKKDSCMLPTPDLRARFFADGEG